MCSSAESCYGPHISADIDRTQVNLNETVTLTGQVCPAAENKTVRVAYTRPDYTYIEQYTLTDPKTGNFTLSQKLDMAGYWNIFVIDGHICDRLFAEVTDPANPTAPSPTPSVALNYKINYSVIGTHRSLTEFSHSHFLLWNKKQNTKNNRYPNICSNRFNLHNLLRHLHRPLQLPRACCTDCNSRIRHLNQRVGCGYA